MEFSARVMCDYTENLTVFSWDFIANRYIKMFREILSKKDYFANILQ
jgi:hypothetical protein